jgi:hypothetical protein
MQLRIPFTEVKELQTLPLEEQQAVIERFNKSDEFVAWQKRTGVYPARVAAILTMVLIGVMSLGYDIGPLPCVGVGFGFFFVIALPLGMLIHILVVRRRLRSYVRRRLQIR